MSSLLAGSETIREDDESSARTSAAAADGDDIGQIEDTVFHGVDVDLDHSGDFDYSIENERQHHRAASSTCNTNKMEDDSINAAGEIISSPFRSGVTSSSSSRPSPPITSTASRGGYESLADLSRGHGLATSAISASSSSSLRLLPTPPPPMPDGSTEWMDAGMWGTSQDEFGVGRPGDGAAAQGEMASVVPPPPREKQFKMVKQVLGDRESVRLKLGEKRYLVSRGWMRRWNDYVGWNSYSETPTAQRTDVPPGPVTNEDILNEDGSALKDFQEPMVECVTEQHWGLLSAWYGGVPIVRPVIMISGAMIVEVYPRKLKLTTGPEGRERTVDLGISKGATVGELRRRGIAKLKLQDVADADIHLWQLVASVKFKDLNDETALLSSVYLSDGDVILFEVKGDSAEDSVVGSMDDHSTSGAWKSDYFSSSRYDRCDTPGAVGLSNLGNTCFMNAAIQCLSHIPQVREYFGGKGGGSPAFLEDINLDNPLGTQGELAKAFGDLVKRIWEGRDSYIFPRDFREVLCNHAQQFLGYDQHDSQEFLAYLLDGIHEDVNRVLRKPYVEKVEAREGEEDRVAAQRAWDAHLRRNDSFIVDTMHGQYKSVVTCPVQGCQKTSTTFDPAMYLSVPLPAANDKDVEVILATLDGRRPKRYCLQVPKTGRVRHLREALCKVSGVRVERLVLAHVWRHNIQNLLEDNDSISGVRKGDVTVAYQLQDWGPSTPPPGDEWEPKLSPFLRTSLRSQELRNGDDAAGRFRLLRSAELYSDRFPSRKEMEEVEGREDSERAETAPTQTAGEASSSDQPDNPSSDRSTELSMQERLKEASELPCSFAELESREAVMGFREAVASLRELVVHEQREVQVQISQHRSSEFETHGGGSGVSSYSRTFSTYHRRGVPFSFPLLLSYLPHSTTVGEFRSVLSSLLRRHVLPRDQTKQRDSMDLETRLEEGEVTSTSATTSSTASTSEDALSSGSPRKTEETPGPGDPGNMLRLLRSGDLQLLTTAPLPRQTVNVFDGGDERCADLLSDWLEEPAYGMTKLELMWSADAIREAYDAMEAQQVEDDKSVVECTDRPLSPLSVRQCLEHFLQREQLDETEMWYCSSCKEHRRAYKELGLWRLPPVLIVHLKRFSYDTTGGWSASREKIDNLVTFPVRGLDIRDLEHAPSPTPVAAAASGAAATADTDMKDATESASNDTTAGSPENGGPTGGRGTGASGNGGDDCPMEDWVVVDRQQQRQHGQRSSDTQGGGDDPMELPVIIQKTQQQQQQQQQQQRQQADERTAESKDRLENGSLYDLWGVVNHYGGLGGGHYTAFVRNEHDDGWYEVSDDHVSVVENDENLVTPAAYVLFYQRRGGDGDQAHGIQQHNARKVSAALTRSQ